LKIGVIVDDLTIPRWSLDALLRVADGSEFVIYNCTNTPPSRKRLKHAAYYALNLFTVRNRLTRGVHIDSLPNVATTVDFEAEQEGLWQRLPPSLLHRIATDRPAVLIKLGMSLLRIPHQTLLEPPILSYHHGDPQRFRGRPAGFWELLGGERVMGQMVQILSNELDAGRVVAFAETKVWPNSYRATLMEAYRHSQFLLKTAIANAVAGVSLPKEATGKLYRLPTNLTVLKFGAKLLRATAARLVEGAFFEKAWRISTASADPHLILDRPSASIPQRSQWTTPELPPGYAFLADPFFHPEREGLLVEGLARATDHGEILHMTRDRLVRVSEPTRHYSYPGVVAEHRRHYVIPETADWSPQHIYRLDGDTLEDAGELRVPGSPRLLDPTLYRAGANLFLFANIADEGDRILRLWQSQSLFGAFEEHPASPIRISPVGARMAGSLTVVGDRLLRFGQDFRGRYGDGLIIFGIDELHEERYRETMLGELRFDEVSGPHTINFRDGVAVFDWYSNRFSALAAVRRLRRARPKVR
jgi:hypothetical protein